MQARKISRSPIPCGAENRAEFVCGQIRCDWDIGSQGLLACAVVFPGVSWYAQRVGTLTPASNRQALNDNRERQTVKDEQ